MLSTLISVKGLPILCKRELIVFILAIDWGTVQ